MIAKYKKGKTANKAMYRKILRNPSSSLFLEICCTSSQPFNPTFKLFPLYTMKLTRLNFSFRKRSKSLLNHFVYNKKSPTLKSAPSYCLKRSKKGQIKVKENKIVFISQGLLIKMSPPEDKLFIVAVEKCRG